MAYSYTEKKRIRKDFGTLDEGDGQFHICSRSSWIPTGNSPRKVDRGRAWRIRSARRLQVSVSRLLSYSGNAALEYVDYSLGKPVFDVDECCLARYDLRLRRCGSKCV